MINAYNDLTKYGTTYIYNKVGIQYVETEDACTVNEARY